MARKYFENVGHAIATLGTGSVTFGAALASYQTLSDAGAVGGDTFGYRLRQNDEWEIGIMTVGTSVTIGARDVLMSSNADSEIDLTGDAILECVMLGADMDDIYDKLTKLSEVELVFEFYNGNLTLVTDMKSDLPINFPIRLTGWAIASANVGTIVMGVWKDTSGNFPPTSLDSMTNGNNPATSADDYASGNVSGWTTTLLSAGDVVRVNLSTVTASTRITLTLFGRKVLT